MRVLFYEDESYRSLLPIVSLRPVFELVCGRESLRRRMARWIPGMEWGVRIRSTLARVYQEQFPSAHVNSPDWEVEGRTLVVNSRWIPEHRECLEAIRDSAAGFVGDELVWISLDPEEIRLLDSDSISDSLQKLSVTRKRVGAGGVVFERPWDLIAHNSRQLRNDFTDVGLSQPRNEAHVQVLGNDSDAYIASSADIDPYVVIDTRKGPVSIEADAKIQSFTRIEGPCHIGRGAHIFRGHIRAGTTVGKACRVGGEVEESILHACVNKYHEGFLGHSYVCPWVNIGAMTTTSDLKNDYSTVSVPVDGDLVDSGLQKVGSFFGDHAKVAIDSMFNTGSSVGVMAMVLPGGRLLPRHIPSFGYVSFGDLSSDLDLDSAISTARIVMNRRGQELTVAMTDLLRQLFDETQPERAKAIQRSVQRRMQA